MNPNPLQVLALALLATSAACTALPGGSSSSSGSPVEQTANAWAAAFCNRLFACLPYASASRADGANEAECVVRKSGYLQRSLAAPGASSDLSRQNDCNAALANATCAEFLDFRQGGNWSRIPACANFAPGTRQDGQGCAYGAQCASNYCASPEGTCGVCRPFVSVEGDNCGGSSPCDPRLGLVCSFGFCWAGRGAGDTCNRNTQPCFDNYLCVNGTCQPYLGLHESCDPNLGNCSYAVDGLVCSNQTSQCEAIETTARAGEVCGLGVPSGGMRNCVPGTMCDMTTPTTVNPYSGVCVTGSAAPPGEPCLFQNPGMNGSACAGEDLSCTNGRCTVADPASCPDR